MMIPVNQRLQVLLPPFGLMARVLEQKMEKNLQRFSQTTTTSQSPLTQIQAAMAQGWYVRVLLVLLDLGI